MTEKTVPTTTEQQAVPATREESRYLVPPVDIYETNDALKVIADLPGVSKENLDVRVENGLLTIKATASAPQFGDPIRKEFELLNYFRQFQLGEQVDQERISAGLQNGVLTLSLPKAEKAKPKRINIETA